MLGMQVGFNARNAIVACDMAARGLAAPESVLEGPFGFFPLFEGEHALGPVLDELGETSRERPRGGRCDPRHRGE